MPCSPPAGQTVTKVYWVINYVWRLPPDIFYTSQYVGRVQYSRDKETDCTLTLSNVRVTDTAQYYARIETNSRNTISHPVNLTVKDLAVQISGPAIEGHEVKLSCKHCILGQNSKIMWRKNGDIFSDAQTSDKELILHNISTDDEGNYSCALEGLEDHPSPPVKLNVMYPPKNTSVSVSPAGHVLEGASVTLTCSSVANPPVESYTWYRQTGDETTEVGSGETITFTLNTTTAGLYHCEATNQIASQNSSAIDVSLAGRQHVALIAGGAVLLTIALIVVLAVVMSRRERNMLSSTSDSRTRDINTQGSADDIYDAQMVDSGDPADAKYASVQFKSSREQHDSTVHLQQEEVVYATVHF
ncbi:B-cell receptor CD22-like [Alosa pseudoharengus]|uniref:B-cell receptor CD22-like n=1 Tax=Alosa pseudoharengus TaxID=34774 RepID=UPI003F8CA541